MLLFLHVPIIVLRQQRLYHSILRNLNVSTYISHLHSRITMMSTLSPQSYYCLWATW